MAAEINYLLGDIFTAPVEAIVNPVNCVGVMGKGLALQFKERFPDNFAAYRTACAQGEVQPGRMFVFDTMRPIFPYYIINFPTKRHWRNPSRMDDIDAGLEDLVAVIRQRHISSIALPRLGCGLGGLPWPPVRQRIEDTLGNVDGLLVLILR